MKILNVLYIGIFSVCALDINAQNTVSSSPIQVEFRVREQAKNLEAEGSPYIQDDFVRASVNDIKDGYLVRYNAAEDLFEFRLDKYNSQVMILQEGSDYRIQLQPSGKVYVSGQNVAPGLGYLVEAHVDRNFSILMKESIRYYPPIEATSSYSSDKPARYERIDDKYYIRWKDGKAELIPDKKKNFAKKFDSYNNSMSAKKVNPGSLEDLIEYFSTAE